MDYNYFSGMVRQFATERVQASPIKIDSCALDKVPRPFALLLNEIIKILQVNIKHFCKSHEKMVLLGFQPAAVAVTSNYPKKQGRVYDERRQNEHYCCTLEFIVAPIYVSKPSWRDTSSLVIDFTQGLVMDAEYFIDLVGQAKIQKGRILGRLSARALDIAWKMLKFRALQKGKPGNI